MKLESLCLKITSRCNYSCRHCWRVVSADNLNNQIIINAIKKFENNGLRHISISGGEPFLYVGLEDLIFNLLQTKLHITLTTNCTFPDDAIKLLHKCKDRKRLNIRISVDGLQDMNDYIRGEGSFRKTINLLEMLIKNNFRVNVNIVAMNINYNQINDLLQFLNNYKINHIGIIKGYGVDGLYGLNEKEWNILRKSIEVENVDFWNYDEIPNMYCIIESDGKIVFPGISKDFGLGNIISESEINESINIIDRMGNLLGWTTQKLFDI